MNIKLSFNKLLGNRGEKAAATYLEKSGYFILEKNYRVGRREIDIIAKKNDMTIAIEVKTITDSGASEKNIPLKAKQAHGLKKALISFCYLKSLSPQKTRLDLILIIYNKKTDTANLYHYPNV